MRKVDPNGDHIWTRQFGTAEADIAIDVAIDGEGNVVLTVSTDGALEGENAGWTDAAVVKFGR